MRNRHNTLTSNLRGCEMFSDRSYEMSMGFVCGRKSLQYSYSYLFPKEAQVPIANYVQVEQNLLFHYLSELEAYRNEHASLNDSTRRHLDLLLGFIKKTYEPTTERLNALLEKCEIIYDLLWALLKPNAIVYTTCVGTGKPRCVKYNFGEERK